jgi:hypothetical protein
LLFSVADGDEAATTSSGNEPKQNDCTDIEWTTDHPSVGTKVAAQFATRPKQRKGGEYQVYRGEVVRYAPPLSPGEDDELWHIVWADSDEEDYDAAQLAAGVLLHASLEAQEAARRMSEQPSAPATKEPQQGHQPWVQPGDDNDNTESNDVGDDDDNGNGSGNGNGNDNDNGNDSDKDNDEAAEGLASDGEGLMNDDDGDSGENEQEHVGDDDEDEGGEDNDDDRTMRDCNEVQADDDDGTVDDDAVDGNGDDVIGLDGGDDGMGGSSLAGTFLSIMGYIV